MTNHNPELMSDDDFERGSNKPAAAVSTLQTPGDAPSPSPASAAPEAPAATAPEAPAASAPAPAGEDFESLVEAYMGEMETVRQGEIVDARVVEVHREYVLVDMGGKSEAFVNIAEFIDSSGEINVKVGDTVPVLVGERDEENGSAEVSYSKARQQRAWEAMRKSFSDKTPVKGRVARVIKGGIEVDVGVMTFCPASQVDVQRIENFQTLVGQELEFMVVELNPRRGRAVLSRRAWLEAERARKREAVLATLQEGQQIKVVVKNIVEFGVFCDLGGIDGLIPREEVSWDRGANPADFLKVGDEVRVVVMSVNREKGKVSLSRRRLRPDPWDSIEKKFPKDSVVSGKVVGMASYGAFVHLEEGITGLLHAGDLTWDKGPKNPADYLKEGDHVKVAVLGINREKRQLSLGLKQITMDPWVEAVSRYPVGSRHKARVSSLAKFGAFVRLEEGIEGLVHISDMSWDKNIRKPEDVVKAGDEVEVEIVSIDTEKRKMSLSMKRLQENPLSVFAYQHPSGSVVEGKVVRLTDFGAFVELAPGIDGLVHVSQISEERIDKPEQALKVGETVKALITKIDADNGKISLSIKDYLKRQEKDDMRKFLRTMGSNHGGHNMGDLLRNAAIIVENKPTPPSA